ncbi:hypothetical protein BC833DRAFT_566232 [Globomyces pollinis-pini]|nr:hypothetical protein BC833DRAFT_566232 [Globomyces pollinis-pini]
MSDFINDNLTVIRISISCLFAGSLLLNVAKSTHYKQLNASNSTFHQFQFIWPNSPEQRWASVYSFTIMETIILGTNLKFKILSVHPDSNLPIGIPLVRLTNIIRYWIKNGCTKVSEPWNITELPNCHTVQMELQVLKELESKKKNRWRWLKSFLNR